MQDRDIKRGQRRKKASKRTERKAGAHNAMCARRRLSEKGTGRMPRHQEPKKDVTSCEKPRGGANTL